MIEKGGGEEVKFRVRSTFFTIEISFVYTKSFVHRSPVVTLEVEDGDLVTELKLTGRVQTTLTV